MSLALQGGGSHGAFTWGGYLEGGHDGARKSLAKFWRSISDAGAFSPAERKFLDTFFSTPLLSVATQWWTDSATHYSSPYDFNPLNINSLRNHFEKAVDFAKVRALTEFKLFVAATNVQTGKIKVFEGPELTADHVMASACLPYLFQAVEIDGVPYWDGGYMGNLFRLFYKAASPDIVIVQINPIERDEVPRSAHQIQDRLNEITVNAALMGELRADCTAQNHRLCELQHQFRQNAQANVHELLRYAQEGRGTVRDILRLGSEPGCLCGPGR